MDNRNVEILLKYISEKRHDYLNDLQVILGYAQLGNPDKIIDYVHKVIDALKIEKDIFKSNDLDEIMEFIEGKNIKYK
ncbi:MAG: Spo0B domain-containing protein [Thermoanaerobacteraceae bacterium]|nr:Spo0B domain-containing protein [Thermoanaerobacteraceae bacterium]